MTDLLERVWRRWDAGSVLTADDVADGPAGAVERFVSLGFLRDLAPAGVVACDACDDGHDARVVWVGDGANRRAMIRCPTEGHVRVDPDRLRRWDGDGDRLVARVADAVGIAGGVTEVVPGRVWRLGKVTLGGKVWAAFVARGLGRPDGESVAAREPGLFAANALVFIPGEPPPRTAWGSGPVPVVVRLADLLTLTDTGLAADRAFLASSCGSPAPALAIATFPTPAGATWADVTMTVGDRVLTITVGETVRRFQYDEVGFADRKAGGKPGRLWAVLGSAAANGGAIPDGTTAGGIDPDVKQAMTDLRSRLRTILGLAADPVPHDRRSREYRPAFRLRTDRPPTFTRPAAGWAGVTIAEVADGQLEVVIDGAGPVAGFEDGEEGDGELVAGERATGWVRRLPVSAFGLTADGVPTPAAAALVAVLRGRGSVRGKMTDPAFLNLGKVLTTAFQTTDPAFDYRNGKWVAKFAADSHVGPS